MDESTATMQAQKSKAERFRELHTGEEVLILPCAWDVASAKVFEAQGFNAIGTTSAGVSAALGYQDGQKIDFQEYMDVIRRIVRRVTVPVSVDIEAGYAGTIDGVVANVRAVLDAGVVGINIEDENHARSDGLTLEPVAHMLRKIGAIREMSDAYGVALFINAKTDAIWLSVGPHAGFDEAVLRANAYGAAGADCVFIPGDLDLQTITRLVKAVPYPLNVVIKDKTPSIGELRSLTPTRSNTSGVKRLSMGSGPMRAAMGLTRKIGWEALSMGTYRNCLEFAIPYDEVKGMFPADP
jgi:2-methylisocitrate lyase-like PEP mutase family enzyme